MVAITKFEDIEAWQVARVLAGGVYKATSTGTLSRDFGLRDQLQRSAVSIMANIAEGFGRRGRQEFIQFLKIARGSCSEVESHLYVALDAGLIAEPDFKQLKVQAETTGRKLSAFIRYLSNQNTKTPNNKILSAQPKHQNTK